MIPLCSIYIRKRCGRTILAAITRLICGGLEAHADLSRRHLKGVFAAAEVGQGNRLAVCVRNSQRTFSGSSQRYGVACGRLGLIRLDGIRQCGRDHDVVGGRGNSSAAATAATAAARSRRGILRPAYAERRQSGYMEPQAIDLLGMGNILDLALGAGLGQHMDDLEGILAVRTVRIRQNNVYAFIREVAFVYRNPLAAVIVFKRDVVKRHAILPAGQFRCQLCLNLFDRIQFRNIFEFLRNGQTADDYLMRFYAHSRHCRYVLDRDGVTAVCVLLGFHCVTAVQRCISGRFAVDAVVAVDD